MQSVVPDASAGALLPARHTSQSPTAIARHPESLRCWVSASAYAGWMGSAAMDGYVEAFLARCLAARPPGDAMIDEPGIHGLMPDKDDGRARLLITDDRARDRLSTLLGGTRAGMITVCAAAAQCAELLETVAGWRAGTATAMICRDLQTVQAPRLPSGLTLRPVRRLANDPPGGVPLTQAVAAACRADLESSDARALAEHLRSLPRAFALWAAVDDGDSVRGTSGSAGFGATASVIFVNTDPDWRHRGIARAMTAIALRAARNAHHRAGASASHRFYAAQRAGARYAGLDASVSGRALYLSLGLRRHRWSGVFVHQLDLATRSDCPAARSLTDSRAPLPGALHRSRRHPRS